MALSIAPEVNEVTIETLSAQFDEAVRLYESHSVHAGFPEPEKGIPDTRKFPQGVWVDDQVIQHGIVRPHRTGDSTHESFVLWKRGDGDSGLGIKRVTYPMGEQRFSLRQFTTSDTSSIGIEEDPHALRAASEFLATLTEAMEQAEHPAVAARIATAREEVLAALKAVQAESL